LYLAKGRCIDINAYDDPFALPSGMGLGPDIRPSAGTRVCFALVSFCYMFFFVFGHVCYRLSWPQSAFQSTLNSRMPDLSPRK